MSLKSLHASVFKGFDLESRLEANEPSSNICRS